MRLAKSKAARIGLAVLLALIMIPVLTMLLFQTLGPPRGVASAAELSVPQPSKRPAAMGAGLQLPHFAPERAVGWPRHRHQSQSSQDGRREVRA
jgi:hypothetical protein